MRRTIATLHEEEGFPYASLYTFCANPVGANPTASIIRYMDVMYTWLNENVSRDCYKWSSRPMTKAYADLPICEMFMCTSIHFMYENDLIAFRLRWGDYYHFTD